MAGRSTMVRTLCRAWTKVWIPTISSFSLRASNFTPSQNRNTTARLFRTELSCFTPLHSAIASAYLVSKLPSEANTSNQGESPTISVQPMDPSRHFETALHADQYGISIPQWFYQRWWHELSDRVTIEDRLGHSFVCYADVVEGRPALLIETNRIRSFYMIPTGALVQFSYISSSHFKFKIPMGNELPGEHVGDDVVFATDSHVDGAISEEDVEVDDAVSDEDGEVDDAFS